MQISPTAVPKSYSPNSSCEPTATLWFTYNYGWLMVGLTWHPNPAQPLRMPAATESNRDLSSFSARP